MKNILVAVVDDHLLFTDSLSLVLDNEEGISVIMKASNGVEFFNKLKKADRAPDVVLMDIGMPEMNGIKATMKLKREYPNIKVIVVTMHYDDSYIISMLENGANGYLFKDTDPLELVRAIIAVNEGEIYYNKRTLEAIRANISLNKNFNPNFKRTEISKREMDVLTLICEAKTAEEIGAELSISKRTVETHRQNLLMKTQSRNIIALVVYAFSLNLVQLRRAPKNLQADTFA